MGTKDGDFFAPLTPEEIECERKVFERWRAETIGLSYLMIRRGEGYALFGVNSAWDAWLTRARYLKPEGD